MKSWIDAHCHLSDVRYARHESGLDRVFAKAAETDVGAFILGGVEPEEWERQRELIARAPAPVFSVFGLHPWYIDRVFESREELENALRLLPDFLIDPACVALGELGLDHGPKRKTLSRPVQREFFERQLDISLATGKPLVLHVVHAHEEALEVLRAKGPFPQGGLVHAFSGSFELASRYLDLGFTISIGGGITRPGYETLKRAVQRIPADRLVIESDSPDFKPETYLSVYEDLNDPGCLPVIAQALAELRGESAQEILERSRQTVLRTFSLRFASN
jgi:TatD DNase family protein